MADAINVAELFLSWAHRDGDLITNLKMQKLLYYAQAWHLVNFNKKPLFNDGIEAWDFGPVIPSVYHEYKTFGYRPIPHAITKNEEAPFTPDQMEYLELLYDKFIRFSAHELVNMSHNEDPWKKAFNSDLYPKIISHEEMTKYYSKLLDNSND
jgi:uncharacterized phage-associated protein